MPKRFRYDAICEVRGIIRECVYPDVRVYWMVTGLTGEGRIRKIAMAAQGDRVEKFNLSTAGKVSARKSTGRNERGEKEFFYYLISTVGEIGFTISLPIVSGALLGSFLDSKLGTYPKMTLSLLLTGVFLSFVGLFHTIQSLIHQSDALKKSRSKD